MKASALQTKGFTTGGEGGGKEVSLDVPRTKQREEWEEGAGEREGCESNVQSRVPLGTVFRGMKCVWASTRRRVVE
jgi:hypothetical protein